MISFFTGGGGTGTPSSLPDYTTNLFEEWVANRGFNVKDNNTDINSWTGYRASTVLTPDLAFGIPSNGELAVGGNLGMTMPATSAVTGNITMAFIIKATARQNAEQRLFHAVSAPQMILQLEKSGANINMGMVYVSQSLDFGVPFPYDNNWHVVVFRILSGVSADLYIDGVKAGNTVTFSTSTAIDWTSSNTRRFFRTASTGTVPFVGTVRKMRIYREALSPANIALISNPANGFSTLVTDNTKIWRFYNEGQSNAMGTGIFSELPPELQIPVPRCYIWDFNFRNWRQLDAGNMPLNTAIGLINKLGYLAAMDHPSDLIYINSYPRGGRSLAVDYDPVTPGAHYAETTKYVNQSNIVLNIEQRTNIEKVGMTWFQGEADATDVNWANAYQTNEPALFTALRNLYGITKIASGKIHNSLPNPSYPFASTVRAAKVAVDAADPNLNLLDTDSTVRFPRQADQVHFTTFGHMNVGEDLYNNLKLL